MLQVSRTLTQVKHIAKDLIIMVTKKNSLQQMILENIVEVYKYPDMISALEMTIYFESLWTFRKTSSGLTENWKNCI